MFGFGILIALMAILLFLFVFKSEGPQYLWEKQSLISFGNPNESLIDHDDKK